MKKYAKKLCLVLQPMPVNFNQIGGLFHGPGDEEKWYGTPTIKPEGRWDACWSRDFSKRVKVGQCFVARVAILLEEMAVTTSCREDTELRYDLKAEPKGVIGDNTNRVPSVAILAQVAILLKVTVKQSAKNQRRPSLCTEESK